jgi:hypothetical protein
MIGLPADKDQIVLFGELIQIEDPKKLTIDTYQKN